MTPTPSTRAVWLITCAGALDNAVKSSAHFAPHPDLYSQLITKTVTEFIDVYSLSWEMLEPALSVLSSDRKTYATVTGYSWHEIVWKIATKQHDAMAIRTGCQVADPILRDHFKGPPLSVELVLQDWPVVGADLLELFANPESFDAEFLRSAVACESYNRIRQQNMKGNK